MPPVKLALLLLVLFAPFQPFQGEELQLPRNVTFVSKDYSLFIKWLPPDGSTPGVSYTVLWMDSFDVQWKEMQHCRNTSETSCDITCVFQEPSNRYWFKVEAQIGTRAGFVSSVPETIDYVLHVELAPPFLTVKYIRNILGVNISFTYPSCMKNIFQDLTYDLEIWRAGSEKRMKYENMHESSVDINTTEWPHGEYCLHARTSFFRNGDKKQSNFLEPLCLWLLGKERKWEFVALPVLAIFLTGVTMLLFYKNKIKQVEMPSALDFSRYQCPKKVLEFDERELTMKNVQLILEQKNMPTHQSYSLIGLSVHSLSYEVEDSDDDSSNPIPYTETLRFQKKDQNCPIDMILKGLDTSSGSGNSQLSEESWPDVTMSRSFFAVERDAPSGILQRTFLSEDPIMDESVTFADDFPAASRECQEVTNIDIDFFNQLIFSESHHVDFSTGLNMRAGGVQCSGICESLENSQSSLCSEPEGQVIEKRCKNDSSNCGDLCIELPHLSMSCKDSVENGELVESNSLKRTYHDYQPKQIHYISRT